MVDANASKQGLHVQRTVNAVGIVNAHLSSRIQEEVCRPYFDILNDTQSFLR